ncbi:MAG: hypothetical protein ACYDCO_21415 [Armatimonadota bacterium]
MTRNPFAGLARFGRHTHYKTSAGMGCLKRLTLIPFNVALLAHLQRAGPQIFFCGVAGSLSIFDSTFF